MPAEWWPLSTFGASPGALVNNTSFVIFDITFVDPLTGTEALDASVFVPGGHVWMHLYTTDGVALLAQRGPVLFTLEIWPGTGQLAPGDVAPVDYGDYKSFEDFVWMAIPATIDAQLSNIEVEFALHTMRKIARNGHIVGRLLNISGSTLAATSAVRMIADLYYQEQ